MGLFDFGGNSNKTSQFKTKNNVAEVEAEEEPEEEEEIDWEEEAKTKRTDIVKAIKKVDKLLGEYFEAEINNDTMSDSQWSSLVYAYLKLVNAKT